MEISKMRFLITTVIISLTSSAKVSIDLKNSRVIRKVPPEYLSIAFDTYLLRDHWGGIDWGKAVVLAGGLSPAYLRIGGTSADFLLFVSRRDKNHEIVGSKFDRVPDALVQSRSNFTITPGDLDRINWFGSSANLDVIFDLNALLRTSIDAWDWNANAADIFNYTQTQRCNFNFELGNEPNLFPEFGKTLSAKQLAHDYATLKSVISNQFPYHKKAKIIGPSLSDLTKGGGTETYMAEFLKNDGAKNLDALSFHHYYFGNTATWHDFVNPKIMDALAGHIGLGKQLIRKYVVGRPDFPLWIGETATAYGAGVLGLSDSFIAGFLWLDKLGLGASLGVDVVIRETLFQGNYALLDENTNPLPDYWLSLLHKQLVDTNVLNIKIATNPSSSAEYTRFYAHCSSSRLTIFGMNLLNDTLKVSFSFREQAPIYFDYFSLSAPNGNLLSKTVLLNGTPLKFDGVRIPKLAGVKSKNSEVMPPYSLAFFAFNQSGVDCSFE